MKTYILTLFCLFFVVYGCNRKEVRVVGEYKDPSKSIEKPRIKYEIDFPDTVFVQEENYGLIKYQSHYDSIITKFGDRDVNRFVRYIMLTTDDVNYDYRHLKNVVKDTFGAYDNRSIYFSVTFSKLGVQYFDGVINDLVLIKLDKKDERGDNLARLLEDEVRVTKKVIVVNKEASK